MTLTRTITIRKGGVLGHEAKVLARLSRCAVAACAGETCQKFAQVAHTWSQSAHLRSAQALEPEHHWEAAQAHLDAAKAHEKAAEAVRALYPPGTRAEVEQHAIKIGHQNLAKRHKALAKKKQG